MRSFIFLIEAFGLLLLADSPAFAEVVCAKEFAQILEAKRNHSRVFLQRYLTPIGKLREIMSGKASLAEKIQALKDADARKEIFYLEALGRIYQEHPLIAPQLEPWFPFFKKFEDALGWAIDHRKLSEKAKKLKAPPKVIAAMEARARQFELDLENFLKTSGWLDTPPTGDLQKLITTLDSIEWPSQSEDAAHVANYLKSEIDRITETEFDMSQLQTGVHALRRKVRWILFESQALQGKLRLIQPEEAAQSSVFGSAEDKEKIFRYIKVANEPSLKAVIELPKEQLEALALFVMKIGDLKDKGEIVEAVQHAILEVAKKDGVAKSAEEALIEAEKLVGPGEDLTTQLKEAQKQYQFLKDSQALEKIHEALGRPPAE